ncbi:DsbA family protein [Phaeovulum vinaykumarii]|uniref:Protein-disulfide isomerase n=1 Tax=Phaeovulum vinaykumarii TaxID=407234 RepID=A0A1N7MV38_9RHOB|nr:DsbA family protein [Phaeovulum vinaykumarii]SIS89987.1 Protein-disulfide isomerase [Phaeovulum vinaykumarii]SOC16887.1 protein-disulfide isomerase [Phaeovulum vinaykumarii]
MTLRRLAPAVLGLALASPAFAFDPAAMNDSERAAFGDAVRAYLMENPEVLVEAIGVLEERQAAAEADNDQVLVETNADAIFHSATDWVGGNPDGDLTLVEFTDYRCGYCRKAYDEVSQLVESDGNIRFVVKEFPILGQQSELSARFAVAVLQLAGPDAYEKAHDALISFRGDITLESLKRLATDQGLDADALLKRMNEEAVTAVLRENHRLAERMRISGTPTFVLGGRLVRGYVPLEGMRAMVAEERG